MQPTADMARPTGFEPVTHGLEGHNKNQQKQRLSLTTTFPTAFFSAVAARINSGPSKLKGKRTGALLIGLMSTICLVGCGSTPVREAVDIHCEFDGEKMSCQEVSPEPINREGLVELGSRPYELDQCFALVKNDMDRKEVKFADRCRLAD